MQPDALLGGQTVRAKFRFGGHEWRLNWREDRDYVTIRLKVLKYRDCWEVIVIHAAVLAWLWFG